jgi:hypothetical protein
MKALKVRLPILYLLTAICFSASLLILTGCDDDDEDIFDRVPPAGKGSLIIDNNTINDIDLYIDGTNTTRIGDYSVRVFDLLPGVYRIVLDEDDGDRNFRDDVDILEGRRTVLDVDERNGDPGRYYVTVEFD